jgi:hypothetical protein
MLLWPLELLLTYLFSSFQGSKDGKTAWKARKAAMEEVDNALKKCSGLLDTSKIKPLVDILRALRERLSDSQSNLKPIAARLIGSILAAVNKSAQATLGKVVYGPLINSAMNDNKKIMHDAAMESLRVGTAKAAIEGEGPNAQALEPFVIALIGALDESEYKVSLRLLQMAIDRRLSKHLKRPFFFVTFQGWRNSRCFEFNAKLHRHTSIARQYHSPKGRISWRKVF